jgi:hypothetical protein
MGEENTEDDESALAEVVVVVVALWGENVANDMFIAAAEDSACIISL